MPQRVLPKSVRATAAASVVTCTAGLVAGQSSEAAPIWNEASQLEGTHQATEPFFDVPLIQADFDQDGLRDFSILFYAALGRYFELYSGVGINTRQADVIFQPGSEEFIASSVTDSTFWTYRPEIFADRNEVFAAGQDFEPLSRPITNIYSRGIQDEFSDRGFMGLVFDGANEETYVGYLDLELELDTDELAQSSLTIYDAGYALIPEPSSLALLGLGGLLLARRRRV